MSYNRTAEARQLLTEIEAWCARTDTREGAIGHVLFLHPGFVGLLRLRLTLSVEKEIAVREFIYAKHPNGYRGELPLTHGNGTKPLCSAKIRIERGPMPETVATSRLRAEEIVARRVYRDACTFCGVRGDIGCCHSRASGAAA